MAELDYYSDPEGEEEDGNWATLGELRREAFALGQDATERFATIQSLAQPVHTTKLGLVAILAGRFDALGGGRLTLVNYLDFSAPVYKAFIFQPRRAPWEIGVNSGLPAWEPDVDDNKGIRSRLVDFMLARIYLSTTYITLNDSRLAAQAIGAQDAGIEEIPRPGRVLRVVELLEDDEGAEEDLDEAA